MGPTIKLVGFLLFLAGAASIFYLQHCVSEYRASVPRPRVVGPLTAIRASFRWTHDPHDPLVSEEYLANFRRLKIAGLVAGTVWAVFAIFVVVGATLDVQRFLG
ncbi:hypothetical protein ACFQZO_30255 [Bradyrhizobium sp. GCM10027634]|uniref:hypothetical protein n=1 Tax=unclassified Bradyrhizobium TaxID=2631580 RepID=UPI001889D6E3|nr:MULTISPECIES: hypothetical protein [unclassified Bradyrhizobium]MDN5005142.1 hypothetical protein [Bradyrhizobium sp. WYCCWR 12677]